MNRIAPILSAILVNSCAILATACSPAADKPPGQQARKAPEVQATRVEVAVLQKTRPRLRLRLPGEVEGARDAVLAAPLGGTVERVSFEVGAKVERGTSLACLDCSGRRIEFERATIEFERAEDQSRRIERAGASISDSRKTEAALALRGARASRDQAAIQLRNAQLRAPFAGTVVAVHVEVGEVLAPAAPVLRLVQLDPVEVSVTVSDRDVLSLAPGMDAAVQTRAAPTIHKGKVKHIASAADLQTRAFEVTVAVANPERNLLPGMIAQVELTRPLEEAAIAIPQHMLVTARGGNGAFVAEGEIAKWRPLELGRVLDDQVVVKSGLELGERLVIRGHRELADGDKIIISRSGHCCSDGRAFFKETK